MSIMNKLTPEQIEALKACENAEELFEKADELALELTEEELAEVVAELGLAEEGELDDDAMDAVAGGADGYYKGYKKTNRYKKCFAGNKWALAEIPIFPAVKKINKCGNCAYARKINSHLVCSLVKE